MQLFINLPNEHIKVKNTLSNAKNGFNMLKDGKMGINLCLIQRHGPNLRLI